MAAAPSSSPSSMLTSMMFAPPSTCSRATATACSNCPSRISRANFFEPVTLVRSPIMMKLLSGRITSGSRPLSRVSGSGRERLARRHVGHGLGDGADVGRRRAAAAADDVQPAVARQIRPARAAIISGVSSKPPNALGSPALG